MEVESITDRLILKELTPHYTRQGLIQDYRHTTRNPTAVSFNLNSGSFKSMTNEEVEKVNSINKSICSSYSTKTDIAVLAPRSMSKYMHIRRRNSNEMMFKLKGVPKRFRRSKSYSRLCLIATAMDIQISFQY